MTKNAGLEHAKKVGFCSGTCINLALQDRHSKKIMEDMKLGENVIDIKKEHMCERGHRSKVLAIYAIESEAKEKDNISYAIESLRYSYFHTDKQHLIKD